MIAEPLIKNNFNVPKKVEEKKNEVKFKNELNAFRNEKVENKKERIFSKRYVNEKKKDSFANTRNKTNKLISLNFFAIIIFVIGIVVGSICYRILIADPIIQEEIVDKFAFLSVTDVPQNEIFKESLVKNMKILAVFWIAGVSVVGIPFIILLCFYKGFSIAFVIASFLVKYGFYKGNFFILKTIFPYYIFSILGIILLVTSSLKVSTNVLKEKKDIRYEIIRHSFVTILSAVLFVISSFIEANIMYIRS